MSTFRTSRSGTVAATLARSRLGVPQVLFFVLAAAAPLTVVAGGASTGYAVTGTTAVPVAYLLIAVVMAVFAVGYVAMSRHVVNAGAMYSYVAHGLGRIPGIAAAFVAVVAYNAMQIGLYGAFGVVAAEVLAVAGATVPWWLCALAGWALVTVLGLARVDLNGRILAGLLLAELAVIIGYSIVMVGHPADGAAVAGLDPRQLLTPGVAAMLVGGIAGFVGVEAGTVFAEETRDPRRTVARATYFAVTIAGVCYAGSAWAMAVAAGPNDVVAQAREYGTELMFVLVDPHIGTTLVDAGRLLFLTSLFAALLAFHNTVARYLFALGRERVLPAALGRTNRRTGAPKLGSLVQSGLAVAVIVGYAATGLDPITHLFFWVTVTGGLGVLILMTVTSLAVIGYFRRDPRGESAWRRLVAPGAATGALGLILVGTVTSFGDLLGIGASPLRWWFPAGYALAALAGVGWALWLRTRRPQTYRTIGWGADSGTAQPVPPAPVRPSARV
ncbi:MULTISPECIES: APC family permease [unclassified Solwaraspora]|uniref:APC family permease n=1 Tax=unclassified Solwaraspora TaxID=2627926 RepID=UPI00248B4AFB|nr:MULTISPECIES: APC family permease [unclassified Solwaraspora]WBB94765.1 APC family permease [Solwaraspora sp. WMMA2059]WBC21349.1 APC family permease [Solwaraspora sp. WMMA2080]WJK36570.1 APC family permease [Solwaraspora sp. WMMA2065]